MNQWSLSFSQIAQILLSNSKASECFCRTVGKLRMELIPLYCGMIREYDVSVSPCPSCVLSVCQTTHTAIAPMCAPQTTLRVHRTATQFASVLCGWVVCGWLSVVVDHTERVRVRNLCERILIDDAHNTHTHTQACEPRARICDKLFLSPVKCARKLCVWVSIRTMAHAEKCLGRG